MYQPRIYRERSNFGKIRKFAFDSVLSSAILCLQLTLNDGEFSDTTMWLTIQEVANCR